MKKIVKLFSSRLDSTHGSDQALKESIDACKALYEYFQKLVEHEKNRFQKLEDKASKFLTMISVIITAFLVVINNFSNNLVSLCSLSIALQFYQVILIILLIFLFSSLSVSWLYLLRILKPKTTRHLPSTQETINAYVQNANRLNEIYEDNAKKMKEVIDEYKSANKIKATFLEKAYQYISISGVLFVIIIPLSIIYKYLT